jgi:hypothetical protein
MGTLQESLTSSHSMVQLRPSSAHALPEDSQSPVRQVSGPLQNTPSSVQGVPSATGV